jgi:hypothetical protein
MTWLEVALVAAVIVGVGAAGFLVAQRPAFWLDMGRELAKRLWPFVLAYVTKRMDPETEERWRQCQRRGGKWNHRTKRCE